MPHCQYICNYTGMLLAKKSKYLYVFLMYVLEQ